VVRGDVRRIRAGDQIVVDGPLLDGRAEAGEFPLTGESEPVVKNPGDDPRVVSPAQTEGRRIITAFERYTGLTYGSDSDFTTAAATIGGQTGLSTFFCRASTRRTGCSPRGTGRPATADRRRWWSCWSWCSPSSCSFPRCRPVSV
jgi:magnesium-transporting ATPase (P-type)